MPAAVVRAGGGDQHIDVQAFPQVHLAAIIGAFTEQHRAEALAFEFVGAEAGRLQPLQPGVGAQVGVGAVAHVLVGVDIGPADLDDFAECGHECDS
ncbi:hypothetical protein D3C85_1238190 [compost metagenome]